MTVHNIKYFKDVQEGIFKTNPLQVVRVADVTSATTPFAGQADVPGALRYVTYADERSTGGHTVNKVDLVLRMVEHTGGAWTNLDVAMLTGGAAVDYQDSNATEGRLLHSNGQMDAANAADVPQVFGALFAEYYDLEQSRIQGPRRVTGLANGDRYWVVVRGEMELLAGQDGTTAGLLICTDVDAAHNEGGRVRAANAMAGPTAAQIYENTAKKALGIALETSLESAFANCRLDILALGGRQTNL